jgi:hypothetical protein
VHSRLWPERGNGAFWFEWLLGVWGMGEPRKRQRVER